MFKAHSNFPLHLAIQHQREDVVFMFIIEHNLEVNKWLETVITTYIINLFPIASTKTK